LTIYAGAVVAFIAWYDDEYGGWFPAFWASLIVSAPLALVGVFGLLIGLLTVLIGNDGAVSFVWIGVMLIVTALLAIVALWAGGRAARKGVEVITGAFSAELKSS